ncbi:MAG: carboxypeptidase regulatory-like domain-containing protein [Acidobacteriaceae bacterium]|nr:carboxypeptidase regulatory-like domain-containing protein [Acidobacteriaceae bacterium]MBV9780613.1 carboxypeptidase regulatory-like domain-containing protein [Acidobacteriaceae bacterium]
MRFVRNCAIIGLVSFLTAAIASSQTGDGSIAGNVRDSSGGAIPNASVEVSSVEQGFTRTTTSNASGDYLVAGLPPGAYNVTVTAKGFEKFNVTNLILRVAEKARADATLTVGAISTEVTVAGTNVAAVETESSELSGVVTGKQIDQLVLNGRNFTQLVTLVPGVSNQTGQDEGQVGVYGNVAYSINGGRNEYNNWELDGGDNMDNGSNSTLNVYPNVDAIAEFKVLTSNYGAQYGRNGSGTIETVTKSGTREFHGDLFEFVRNEDFNARGFFQTTRPAYKKNDYGYTIGGPVFIPKLYNTGRQKTFFFFSEDWHRDRVPGQTYHQQTAPAAERSGNFNDVCPGPDCPINPATHAPFPGNQVPVDPNAQILLGLIPAPNAGAGTESFFNAAPVTPTNWRQELARVDENFSDKVRFFYRFTHDSWNTVVPNPLWGNATNSFPTVQTTFVGPGVSMVANLAISASPTLLNETVFSYTTDHIFLNALGNASVPSNFTMKGLYNNGFGGLLPAVEILNGTPYGGGFGVDTGYFPWNNANPTYTYKDQLTKIMGAHNLYFGAYVVLAEKNEDNSPQLQGILNFSNTSKFSTGNAFADFLTGRIASYQQTNAKIKYYNRYKIVEPYFQDDWHVTKKLTLNLGLRLSLFGTYRDKYKDAYNWEPGLYNPAQAPAIQTSGPGAGALVPGVGNPFDGIVQCGASGIPRGCVAGHLFNPAPRFGFAYDPVGDGKTAIRGGYGIFFEHTNGNEGNTESLEGSPPLVLSSTQYNIVGYNAVGAGGLVFPLGGGSFKSIPTKAYWPYMQQWHFDVQRDLGERTVLTVSYVGSKGTHLTDQRDFNQIFPLPANLNPYHPGQPISSNDCSTLTVNGVPVTGQAAVNLNVACGANPNFYRPFAGFGTITGLEDEANSSYNAMQVSARHYIGHLNVSLAYTWSHSIDDSSDRGDNTFVNSYNLESTRASSQFDQRHLLNISYVYDLPFFTKPGLLHTVLGAWQISGLITHQSGTPFSIINGTFGDSAGVGNGVGTGSFVNIVGNPYAPPPVTNVPGIIGPLLYNPAAFAAPTGLTFGTAGRDILNNPSRTNWDVGLFKHFPLRSETRAIEFRAEAFNVLNHTQWDSGGQGGSAVSNTASCYAGPNNSAGDPSCVSTSTFLHPTGAHNPRIMQLGMKFLF